ncbi:hypothetical protein HHK36_023922 [Tetracentron sinense]|uniref:Retrovirus-related Pol polyprotein from transposon TNT 1-94-like beta-barrel domain-containing protein n=1 Tax=Tetracentron sinense TaxID=13715 RepID=A0A834YR32_TETSI|nr:hypothetical protein HHK36_023922 [Tetracentron sinense]
MSMSAILTTYMEGLDWPVSMVGPRLYKFPKVSRFTGTKERSSRIPKHVNNSTPMALSLSLKSKPETRRIKPQRPFKALNLSKAEPKAREKSSMKKLYRKGKVHPSPPLISDHLAFLPATILTLTVTLSPEDREVLAYLISCSGSSGSFPGDRRNTQKSKSVGGVGDHPPMFRCNCFRCYMSYWVRWDSSPNRQVIHEIIDAFEDGLLQKKNTKNRKERRKGVYIGSDEVKGFEVSSGGDELDESESVEDQLLLGWLITYLSDEVLPQIIGINTCHEVWQTLETSFAAHSRARILQLRMELQVLKKGSDPISKYFQRAKTLAHQLAAAARPIQDEDLLLYILGGLPSEYGPFRTSISTRVESISLADLLGFLLTEEFRIAQDAIPSDLGVAANIAHRSTPPFDPNRNQQSFRGQRYHNTRTPRSRGRGRFSGHQRHGSTDSSASYSGSRPICQVCNRYGHVALQCHNRFNEAFHYAPPTPHTAQAYSSTLHAQPSDSWFPDSGATHHITSDLSNLTFSNSYNGSDSVKIGNGSSLAIHHIGHSTIHTPTSHFKMKNILHVPSVAKNLLFVNKFTKDNNCLFEFYPSHFSVKDIQTGKTLIQGPSSDGLYELRTSNAHPIGNKAALLHESLDSWHQRLGHPALRTTQSILQKLGLHFSSNNERPNST